MTAKASAIEIDELKTVMAKPTPSPAAAEMAIWRHFGEIIAKRFDDCEVSRFAGFVASCKVEFIGVPISSLVQHAHFST
jgi:hypothetical protein